VFGILPFLPPLQISAMNEYNQAVGQLMQHGELPRLVRFERVQSVLGHMRCEPTTTASSDATPNASSSHGSRLRSRARGYPRVDAETPSNHPIQDPSGFAHAQPSTQHATASVCQTSEIVWVKRFRDPAEFSHSVTILHASGPFGPKFHTDIGSQTIHMDHGGQTVSEYLRGDGRLRVGQAEIHGILTQIALYLGSLHGIGLYHGDIITERAHRLLSPVLTDCGIHLDNVLVRPDASLCFIDPHTPTAAMQQMEKAFVRQWTPPDCPASPSDQEEGYVTPVRGSSGRRCLSSIRSDLELSMDNTDDQAGPARRLCFDVSV
jgi:hypothetical protein